MTPQLVILGGPNGAGKTTFARTNLTTLIGQHAFLNADEIAHDVNPSDVEAVAVKAAREMLRQRKELVRRQRSFCIETTLATRTLLPFVLQAKEAGFQTRLVFLFTPFPYLNELRVKQRVMLGGHNIDTDTIRRRHRSGLGSLARYWEAIDEALVFDARTRQPGLIVRKHAKDGIRIEDEAAFALLQDTIAAAGGRPLA